MKYVTRPLTPEAKARLSNGPRGQHSQFASTWGSTLSLLERELGFLGVRYEFVMQIDISESDLKLDGELRANARPLSPSVAIAIESKSKGSLLFTCGRFWKWQDNVRAIALGLEALRKVERYGIVQSNEQYRGWQALPPGTPTPAAKMTVEDAARFLIEITDEQVATVNDVIRNEFVRTTLYRAAAKKLHPDVPGGDPDLFRKLTEAREVLAA